MSKFMESFGLRTQPVTHYNDILRHREDFDRTDVRQAELVMSDPYYGRLYNKAVHSDNHATAVQVVADAGCFDDTLDRRPERDGWFLSAPYDILRNRYQEGGRNIVLISTGSYDPMRNGHVTMLTLARDALQKKYPDATIVGGIMSSSHDAYVRKYKTPDGPNHFERVQNNKIFLEQHPDNQPTWILHDDWETRGVSAAVNFTDVINHVQEMLTSYVGEGVELYYVFGSGAQGFANTFSSVPDRFAAGICIQRPGYDINAATAANPRCLVVEGGTSDSSTAIRAASKNYVLRGDAEQSTAHLSDKMSDYPERISVFRRDLHRIFRDVFGNLEVIDLERQLVATQEFLAENYPSHHVVSSDVYFPGDTNVRSSRLFHPGSSQHHSFGITPVSATGIPPNAVFVDDDIYSGYFLSQIQKEIPMKSAVSMSGLVTEGHPIDTVDERDFLIGARHGGLVMSHNGYVRFPYLDPFVNLSARASIPFHRVRDVNQQLWEANRRFYQGTNLRPGDVGADFLYILGCENHSIEQTCQNFKEKYS